MVRKLIEIWKNVKISERKTRNAFVYIYFAQGMILSDFGATVTKIDRIIDNPLDSLAKGKRTIAINIKNEKGQQLVRTLCKKADVLIEPYRPGVMEKLNLGPKILLKENPRLIYARLTGFGQTGPLAQRAGHDINYIAVSGIMSMLGKPKEPPTPPINLIGNFGINKTDRISLNNLI